MLLDVYEPWMASAKCANGDPDVMYPEHTPGINQAVAICRDCPVLEPCLNHALNNKELHGIWGGTTEKQRRRLFNRRSDRRKRIA